MGPLLARIVGPAPVGARIGMITRSGRGTTINQWAIVDPCA
jgi:hypothetical protein